MVATDGPPDASITVRHPSPVCNGAAQRCGRSLLKRSTRELSGRELSRSAIVFSPHFDDETLGCGGTILRKRAVGARVAIVFMTDGGNSHRNWIGESELCRLRAAEGMNAATRLGVAAADVICLGFKETRLKDSASSALRRVAEILEERRPEQIFLPHRLEPPNDHSGCFQIVQAAVAAASRPVTLFEYPIWMWNCWPWVRSVRRRHAVKGFVRVDLRLALNLLFECRCGVYVGDVLEHKWDALKMHASQMRRLNGAPDWPTLDGVSQGQFLGWFFQEFERFARTNMRR